MQQLTHAQAETALQARPVAAARAQAAGRLAYIDVIRAILIVLVIMVHAAVTYGAFGDWTFRDPSLVENELTSILLSLFNFICQSFFMGLFFFYSGYFTPASYDHKGIGRYWKDRLLRLGIPMLLYTYFLSRLPNYLNEVANQGLRISFWQFSANTFLRDPDGGPTWFLFALLVFSLGYTLLRLAARELRLDFSWASRLPAPGIRALLGTALVFSLLMFAVAQVTSVDTSAQALNAFNLMVAFFPAYILLFTFGLLAYRSQWLARLDGKMLRFWAWFSAALIVLLPVYLIGGGAASEDGLNPFLGGFTWQCAGLCLWFGLACIAFSTALTLWLRGRVQPQNKLAAWAGPNTFAVYLIHPLVLVPITYALSFVLLPAMLKFLLASLLTVILCYALADLLRRLPGVKRVL